MSDPTAAATDPPQTFHRDVLEVSRLDATVSLFTSLIVLLGTLVLLMLVLWLTHDPVLRVTQPVIQPLAGGTSAAGESPVFEVPGAGETEAITEIAFARQLEAVTQAAGQVAIASEPGAGGQGMGPPGEGGQRGRSALAGPDDGESVGPVQRWEIRFNVVDRDDYARQLDHFRIELAAFGGGENVIESASHLSSIPLVRVNRTPESEKRLYFSWKRDNPLLQFDQYLLSIVGIRTGGRSVVRLIPDSLRRELLQLERDRCLSGGRAFPGDIVKTVFQSRSQGDGFVFEVIRQRYRGVPAR